MRRGIARGKLARTMETTRAYRVCRGEKKGEKRRATPACHSLHLFSRWPNNGCRPRYPPGLNIIINVAPGTSGLSLSLSLSFCVCMCVYVYIHIYVCGRIVTLATPLGSFLASRIFSAHFLTARRTARYGDQMRADRVSSIVYTLKKPLLLTSREEYHDLLPSAFDPRALSLSALCLSLRFPESLVGSFVRKELPAVKRLLSRCERRSSARIDRAYTVVVFDSTARVALNCR